MPLHHSGGANLAAALKNNPAAIRRTLLRQQGTLFPGKSYGRPVAAGFAEYYPARFGKREEVAEKILFLAAAGSYITWQVISVDGGIVM